MESLPWCTYTLSGKNRHSKRNHITYKSYPVCWQVLLLSRKSLQYLTIFSSFWWQHGAKNTLESDCCMWQHFLPAVWPWASHLLSLDLGSPSQSRNNSSNYFLRTWELSWHIKSCNCCGKWSISMSSLLPFPQSETHCLVFPQDLITTDCTYSPHYNVRAQAGTWSYSCFFIPS